MTDAIRPAATVILCRQGQGGPEVLMGQRGAGAVFMPSKFVFPGGGVDPQDHGVGDAGYLSPRCRGRLQQWVPAGAPDPDTLVAAALRELTEETGLSLPPAEEPAFRFMFRAITPPWKGRRFDARFFLAQADESAAHEDFSASSGELQHLRWLNLPQARELDLPFITEVVLAEVGALLAGQDQPGVPFFDNSTSTPMFRRIV